MKTAFDLVAEVRPHITEISLQEAESAIRDADFLIDVREKDEYQAGHIPGALSISRGLLEFRLSTDPELASRDSRFVLYCKTSGRAALCAYALKEMGYHQIQSLAGGFDAWQSSGRPVAHPSVTRFE